ncbi:hypothetical protein Xszus_01090 [Xenorhabdus szentirmaii]|uniref:Uncharacterized protein n=1 Tax=Xenorhabdus szentirmaii DSM 16338 TaxID=1427518 RepID=W1ISZ2_9GAMM|nr:hypothetical protein Xsze_03034 [Xenorhabdus szentirmaii DSM 16338]PHM41403.1 hypothetical protein Xszus_01090 [Xenorhabdus szentirmaii]CDL80923.1 hypothetical protein XSR1_10353 [Xenorhabdus szentirmaii DSM 16338]
MVIGKTGNPIKKIWCLASYRDPEVKKLSPIMKQVGKKTFIVFGIDSNLLIKFRVIRRYILSDRFTKMQKTLDVYQGSCS